MAKNKNIANIDPAFLDNLLKSAVRKSVSNTFSHLLLENEKEKKKQGKVSDKLDKLNLRAEEDDGEDQQEQEEAEVEVSVEEKDPDAGKIKAQKLPEAMEADDIAKMLNIIRSGKSLKDPEVQERFDIWFAALAPPEKVALKGFLDGIAQIIAGDVEAEEASKPSAAPYNVEMGATPKKKPRRALKKDDKKSGEGDDAAGVDTPIVVGEVNSTTKIKRRMIG